MASRKKQSQKGGKLITLLGLAAGAAIGAGVALVYSPDKGEDNRKNLRGWAGARVEDLQTKVEDRVVGQ